MFRTLLSRLILSHILPFLIIIPLMGLAIIYVMETQVITPTLARELKGDASLIASIASDNRVIWQDSSSASEFLNRIDTNLSARVMFLDPQGKLIASSDPSDEERIGEYLNQKGLQEAKLGNETQVINRSQSIGAEVIDVFMPVLDEDGSVLGIIRLSHEYSKIYEDFMRVRYFIAIILMVGLVMGGLIAIMLSFNIGSPIRKVTQTVNDIAMGEHKERIIERGPEEIQTLARAVNVLNNRLNDLEVARKQLLANLVHELGRPLGALRSAIQALAGGAGKDPELLQELTEGMNEETVLLEHLLDDLSHLYDQELGVLELNREPIHLQEWVPLILRPWKEAARKKRLRWETNIAPDLPVLYGDRFRLAQVIENLVGNAIKYTPRKGAVLIDVSQEVESIVVRVKDTGPGISPQEKEQVFTPFFRGDQKHRIKQGMGLGLSISRDLVIAHGGEIILESTPGLGSEFTVRLPLNP